MCEVSEATLCFAELLDSARGIGQESSASEDGEGALSQTVDSMDAPPRNPSIETRTSVATTTDDQPHRHENRPSPLHTLSRSNLESDTMPSSNTETSCAPEVKSLLNAHSNHEPAPRQVLPIAMVSSLHLAPRIAVPRTYSFQETSRARRLQRACIESAYHLLLDPTRNPSMLHYAFKFSPLRCDREKLAAIMRQVLDRGIDEALDIWEAPPVRTGVKRLHHASNQVEERLASQADTVSSESEWLDSYDVQAYLEGIRIYVNAGASFAEATLFETPAKSGCIGMVSPSLQGPSIFDQHHMSSKKAWYSEAWNAAQGYHVDWASWNIAMQSQIDDADFDRAMTPVASCKRTVTMDDAEFVKGMLSLVTRRWWCIN